MTRSGASGSKLRSRASQSSGSKIFAEIFFLSSWSPLPHAQGYREHGLLFFCNVKLKIKLYLRRAGTLLDACNIQLLLAISSYRAR